jgi:hypothetical protein
MALLGAYKIHGDMQMGKKWTLENEPIIGYVLLSNVYALTFYLNQGMIWSILNTLFFSIAKHFAFMYHMIKMYHD